MWEAVLGCVQQLFVVFVLQTVSQMFLHGERGSMAGVQCEQQHTDSNWERRWREKYSKQGTSISIFYSSLHHQFTGKCSKCPRQSQTVIRSES